MPMWNQVYEMPMWKPSVWNAHVKTKCMKCPCENQVYEMPMWKPSVWNAHAKPSVWNAHAKPSVWNAHAKPSVWNAYAKPSVWNAHAKPNRSNWWEYSVRLTISATCRGYLERNCQSALWHCTLCIKAGGPYFDRLIWELTFLQVAFQVPCLVNIVGKCQAETQYPGMLSAFRNICFDSNDLYSGSSRYNGPISKSVPWSPLQSPKFVIVFCVHALYVYVAGVEGFLVFEPYLLAELPH